MIPKMMNKALRILMLCFLVSFSACSNEGDVSGDETPIQFDTKTFYTQYSAWREKNITNYEIVTSLRIHGDFIDVKATVVDGFPNVTLLENSTDIALNENPAYCLKTVDDVFDFIFDLYIKANKLNYHDKDINVFLMDWAISYDTLFCYPKSFYFSQKYSDCKELDDLAVFITGFKILD